VIFLALPLLAALVVYVVFLRADGLRDRRRGMVITGGAAFLLGLVGMLLMGIPGAVLYELAAPWVRLALGEGYRDLGDGAWPAAIFISLVWPSSLVLAYAASYGPLRGASRWVRLLAWVLIPYGLAVALAFWAHWSARSAG